VRQGLPLRRCHRKRLKPIQTSKRMTVSSRQHPLNNGFRTARLPMGCALSVYRPGRFQTPDGNNRLYNQQSAGTCDQDHFPNGLLIPLQTLRKTTRVLAIPQPTFCILELYCTIQGWRAIPKWLYSPAGPSTACLGRLELVLELAQKRRIVQIFLRCLIRLVEKRGSRLGRFLVHRKPGVHTVSKVRSIVPG